MGIDSLVPRPSMQFIFFAKITEELSDFFSTAVKKTPWKAWVQG